MLRNDDLLEMQADTLLRQSGSLGRGSGAYTEKQLRRHTRREIVNTDMALTLAHQAEVELDEMVIDDLQELGRLAMLTENQQEVWNLRILGLNTEEIAGICSISRQAVHDRLTRARVRVIKTMVRYPYFGLWEVYYKSIHRTGKHSG